MNKTDRTIQSGMLAISSAAMYGKSLGKNSIGTRCVSVKTRPQFKQRPKAKSR